MADISYEVPRIRLFVGMANAPANSGRAYDILSEAVRGLEQCEDSLKNQLEIRRLEALRRLCGKAIIVQIGFADEKYARHSVIDRRCEIDLEIPLRVGGFFGIEGGKAKPPLTDTFKVV
jgi:hypothetical protein